MTNLNKKLLKIPIMTYTKPNMTVRNAETVSILAVSLPIIKGTEVPGPNAQTKKNEWDIFGDDIEEE